MNSIAPQELEKAAANGDSDAQYNLGNYYANGRKVTTDQQLWKSAIWPWPPNAINQLEATVKAEAVKWYRKSAEQGNSNAQFNLGLCYACGFGVLRNDVEAVKWYRKAAEQGHSDAQYELGDCYLSGNGVTCDSNAAVEWCHKAAKQGHIEAQNTLGRYYENGIFVEEDLKKAAKWYRKAAEQRPKEAQAGQLKTKTNQRSPKITVSFSETERAIFRFAKNIFFKGVKIVQIIIVTIIILIILYLIHRFGPGTDYGFWRP